MALTTKQILVQGDQAGPEYRNAGEEPPQPEEIDDKGKEAEAEATADKAKEEENSKKDFNSAFKDMMKTSPEMAMIVAVFAMMAGHNPFGEDKEVDPQTIIDQQIKAGNYKEGTKVEDVKKLMDDGKISTDEFKTILTKDGQKLLDEAIEKDPKFMEKVNDDYKSLNGKGKDDALEAPTANRTANDNEHQQAANNHPQTANNHTRNPEQEVTDIINSGVKNGALKEGTTVADFKEMLSNDGVISKEEFASVLTDGGKGSLKDHPEVLEKLNKTMAKALEKDSETVVSSASAPNKPTTQVTDFKHLVNPASMPNIAGTHVNDGTAPPAQTTASAEHVQQQHQEAEAMENTV